MHGKRIIASFILVMLLLAVLPCHRSYAFAPAIPAAVYYAIAATATAGGLYATNKESMDYYISDYWNKSSDFVKKQWTYTVTAGWMGGKMIVDGALSQSMVDYLRKNYETGSNVIYRPDEAIPWANNDGKRYAALSTHEFVIVKDGLKYNCKAWEIGGSGIEYVTGFDYQGCLDIIKNSYFAIEGGLIYFYYRYSAGGTWNRGKLAWDAPGSGIGVEYHEGGAEPIAEVIGDTAGFGAALSPPDQEIKVPCPPVPPTEWPDRWIDDLERELNDVTADQYVENMDQDFDWYIDKDGSIYKRKKGEGPKKEDDTKLVPPIPPPYQPVHPEPGQPGPATPDQPWVPAEPCPYCPAEPGPGPECPNPYCPNHPAPQTPPVRPDQPVPDDRYIDFEPLKKLPHIFTTKFPFSLPWDLMRGVKSLEGGQWDRKFRIAAVGDYWPEMEIDVSMFDDIAGITRVVFLIMFDFALIFATRRLMGGDI